MAIKKQHTYSNGGKLLMFEKGGMKYIPSQAYQEHVRKLTSKVNATRKTSTEKNCSKLIDAIFAKCNFETPSLLPHQENKIMTQSIAMQPLAMTGS